MGIGRANVSVMVVCAFIAVALCLTTPVRAQTNHSGQINADQTWSVSGNPHIVTSNVTVNMDVVLRLEPGVFVCFNQNTSLIVNGSLRAVGTSGQKINFTSTKDTTGGTPGVHDWQSLKFTASSVNDSLVNCVIKYGGGYYSSGWRVAPTIDIAGCSPVFICSRFDNCYGSFVLTGSGAQPTFTYCNFIATKSQYAMQNVDATVTINAQNCYWGDPSGPYDPTDAVSGPPDSNPGGLGGRVSDNISYRPWSGEAFPNEYLSSPTNVHAYTEDVGKVHLTWHPVVGALNYDVLISISYQFNDTVFITHGDIDTLWTDSLGEGTYYGKVRAVGCCAWSGWSDSVEIVIVDDDIEEFPSATLPKEFRLEQNHPNPFNPATTIEYDVPIRSLIKIEVYNLLGQSVRVLLNAHKSSGNYRITWDGKDSSGRSVSSGIYFYRFQAGDYVETKKMVLMK